MMKFQYKWMTADELWIDVPVEKKNLVVKIPLTHLGKFKYRNAIVKRISRKVFLVSFR